MYGDNDSFRNKKDGWMQYEQTWAVISDTDRAAALDDHHVHKWLSYILDSTNKGEDGKYPLWIRRLHARKQSNT
eukprot:4318966-Karenia_brevis.AAC.1